MIGARNLVAALACVAAALLTSCSGVQPSVAPLTPSFGSLRSDARGALLYVSDTETGDVYVFSYPKGTLQQTLSGFRDPAGECVDGKGNVFITNTGGSNVVEYAHGGSAPIATLKDKGYFPVGCSIDPTTGNLAVTNDSTVSGGPGDVVIYKSAKGSPRAHFAYAAMSQMLLCGYDAAGNLYVDGLTTGNTSVFAWKTQRGKLGALTLDQSIGSAGGVQWDGKHLAIGDQSTNTIYQFSVAKGHGKRVGATLLGGASMVFQFWIDGTNVIGPDAGAADVGIWKYPQGGAAIKTIGGVYVPLGATISR